MPTKILHPHGEATREEIEEILRLSIKGRKRVKDQILRLDSTMPDVKFGYRDTSGGWHTVSTLEEDEYPPITTESAEATLSSRARRLNLLLRIKQAVAAAGIRFDVALDDSIHERSIVTDMITSRTGWSLRHSLHLNMESRGQAFLGEADSSARLL